MKRTAFIVALLALSGCLTECGAVGHGVIGRGVVSDGAIGGGAVGGRPSGVDCGAVPGSPSYLFDADEIAQADATAVATWEDLGSLGSDASQATPSARPTLQVPCEGGGVLNSANCVDFDGGDSLKDSGVSLMAQPNLAFAVYRFDTSTGTVFDDENGNHRNIIYQASGRHTAFAGANLLGATVTTGQWVATVASFDSTNSFIRVNGSETTGNPSTAGLSGITLGAFNTGAVALDGAIAIVGFYDDAGGVTADDIETYLSCRYGSFPQ